MVDRQLAEVTVPAGLRPGDVPGVDWPKSLWVILPASPSKSQSTCISALRTKIESLEASVSEVRVRNMKGIAGIEFPLIPARDVAGLYRRAHRTRTAVIAFGSTKILLDISERPSNKGCVSLEQFVRYKCSYGLISRPAEVDGVLANAIAWMNNTHCEGTRDPRCLPAAVFETREQYSLNTRTERQVFMRLHKASRRGGDLIDVCDRTWQIGPEHTMELIQVAGRTLPVGFHWDVQARRDSVIVTGWERWKLRGRGYTNVHPDALIRGGNATKTHPASPDKDKPRSPKTSRDSRQSKRRK